MVTVHHPTIPDITYDVSEDNVKEWTDAGWLKNEPRNKVAQQSKED